MMGPGAGFLYKLLFWTNDDETTLYTGVVAYFQGKNIR